MLLLLAAASIAIPMASASQLSAPEPAASSMSHAPCNDYDGIQSDCWDGDRLCAVYVGHRNTNAFCLLYY